MYLNSPQTECGGLPSLLFRDNRDLSSSSSSSPGLHLSQYFKGRSPSGKSKAGVLVVCFSAALTPVHVLLAGTLFRRLYYDMEIKLYEGTKWPVVLMEPMIGSSTLLTLESDHPPPGGSGLAKIVTNIGIVFSTLGVIPWLHGNIPG